MAVRWRSTRTGTASSGVNAKDAQSGDGNHALGLSPNGIIPVALKVNPCPIAGADRSDSGWIVDQEVPALFAGIDNSLIAVPNACRACSASDSPRCFPLGSVLVNSAATAAAQRSLVRSVCGRSGASQRGHIAVRQLSLA